MNRMAALLWIMLLALAGCMRLGPDYQRPDAGVDIPKTYQESQRAQARAYIPQEKWWTRFEDPRLNQVVEEVLENNPDIQKAAAAVLEYRALLRQSRSDQYPRLNLDAQAARQARAVAALPGGETVRVETDAFSLSLPASFELDLWGRLRRAAEAARGDLLAAEENRHAIVQSLIAEAVSQYFTVGSLAAQLEIAKQLTETDEENLALVEARYEQGLASILDVHQARRSLAQSEAQIPPLRQALGKAQHALSLLKGKYPAQPAEPPKPADAFSLPPPVPAGLPSELLVRRPDIRSAEAALQAACARIGAAKANRFPQITLTGSFGYSSEELTALFEPENELWQIAAGIFQPLFDAGKRKAVQRAAEARYERQLAVYAKTVLEAFSEVEGALLTRREQIDRYERLEVYLKEAGHTLETAMDRYQRGLADYLNVLDAQKALFQARLNLVETRTAIYTNRVRLYRALGGGWGGVQRAETSG